MKLVSRANAHIQGAEAKRLLTFSLAKNLSLDAALSLTLYCPIKEVWPNKGSMAF